MAFSVEIGSAKFWFMSDSAEVSDLTLLSSWSSGVVAANTGANSNAPTSKREAGRCVFMGLSLAGTGRVGDQGQLPWPYHTSKGIKSLDCLRTKRVTGER